MRLVKTQLRRERLERLQAVLREADCGAALFFDPINIRYATDVSNMQVWCLHNPARYVFVAADGPVVLFEFNTCEHLAASMELVDEVRPANAWIHLMAGTEAQSTAARAAAEIAELLRAHGGGTARLAVDRIDHVGFLALRQEGVEVVEGQSLAEQARAIKCPQEILAMRDAIAACESAVTRMRESFEPGISEQALWSVLHQQNIASGGEWIETRLLTSGPRTNPWYQECSERPIARGELIALDTDLIGRHGYCCDISRTWSAGEDRPNDAQCRTYELAYNHLRRILETLGPDLSLDELSWALGPAPEGFRTYSCLIHGIGLCDEYPVAFWSGTPGTYDTVIEPGMTLCVESYFGPESGGEGVKLEEQVLVTASGIEVLSSLPFEEDWL
jgi:Xaa-Pro aminopeptidase